MDDEKQTVDKSKENQQSTELSTEQVEKVVGGATPIEYGLVAPPVDDAIIVAVNNSGPADSAIFEKLANKP